MRRRGSSSDGKNDPARSFGIATCRSPAFVDTHPRAVTVALGDPAVAAFVAAGADRRGGFDLDQLLQRPTGELADQIDAIGRLQRGQQIGQGRLRQSHRCVLLQVSSCRNTPRFTPMAHLPVDPRIPTTPRGSVQRPADIVISDASGRWTIEMPCREDDVVTAYRAKSGGALAAGPQTRARRRSPAQQLSADP